MRIGQSGRAVCLGRILGLLEGLPANSRAVEARELFGNGANLILPLDSVLLSKSTGTRSKEKTGANIM